MIPLARIRLGKSGKMPRTLRDRNGARMRRWNALCGCGPAGCFLFVGLNLPFSFCNILSMISSIDFVVELDLNSYWHRDEGIAQKVGVMLNTNNLLE
jgi:hypothetical protein